MLACPTQEQEEAEEHTAEVGKVCHVVVDGERRVKFERSITNDEVFCLHRDGRNEQHDAVVGIDKPEGKQDAVDSP